MIDTTTHKEKCFMNEIEFKIMFGTLRAKLIHGYTLELNNYSKWHWQLKGPMLGTLKQGVIEGDVSAEEAKVICKEEFFDALQILKSELQDLENEYK